MSPPTRLFCVSTCVLLILDPLCSLPCLATRSLQPFSLHLVLKPFNAEQSRQFVTAALRGAQVRSRAVGALNARSRWRRFPTTTAHGQGGRLPLCRGQHATRIRPPQHAAAAPLAGMQVPPDVAQLLWERSNGLPSFLEQLVVFLQVGGLPGCVLPG